MLAAIFPGKDGKVFVFRLMDFEGEDSESIVRSKADCKEHKIEKTKGIVRQLCFVLVDYIFVQSSNVLVSPAFI